jgi:hypothetical protein
MRADLARDAGSAMGIRATNIKAIGAVGSLLVLALCAAAPAKAAVLDYHFDLSGPNFAGHGDIFVNSQLDALGGHDIQGITGSISGPAFGPITGLIGTAPNSQGLIFTNPAGQQWTYDNVLYTNGVAFDNNGALFGFGPGFTGNLYSIGTQLYLSASDPKRFFLPGDPIRLQISSTPLPATLPMFLAGLGGLWFLLRRRNKRVAGTELKQLLASS